MKRKCSTCGKEKELNADNFRPKLDRPGKSRLSYSCRPCQQKRQRNMRQIKKSIVFTKLSEQLGSLCPICGSPATAIDHNHQTNKIRGLLCMSCNTGLGCFADNIDNLRRAIVYIKNNCELGEWKEKTGGKLFST